MTNTNIWMNLPKVQSEETEKISSPTEVKQDCFPLKIIKTQNIILSEQKNGNKSFKLFNIIHPKTKEIEAAKPNFDQPSETFLQVKVPRAKGRIKNKKESERIKEIDEQYNKFISDKEFQNKFDYILYNKYDIVSEKQILDLVKNLITNE